MVHRITKVFTTMRRDENQPAIRGPFELRMRITTAHSCAQGVNASITCHPNFLAWLSFLKQVSPACLCGRKVKIRNDIHGLPIELLRPRAIDVVRTKSRFNMPHGNMEVEASKRGCKGSSRISMHQYDIWLFLLKNSFEPKEDFACNVKQRLTRFHDCQIIFWSYAENPQHLVQHFSMLTSNCNDCLKFVGSRFQLFHEGAHLYCFRTCPEHKQDLYPIHWPCPSGSPCEAGGKSGYCQLDSV